MHLECCLYNAKSAEKTMIFILETAFCNAGYAVLHGYLKQID